MRTYCFARRRWLGLLGAAGVSLAAGCTPAGAPDGPARTASAYRRAPDGADGAAADLLYVTTKAGLSAIETGRGRPLFALPPALPSPTWAHLFTATPTGQATRLAELDPRTGAERNAATLHGLWEIAAASATGLLVALTPRQEAVHDAAHGAAHGAPSPYVPVGRERTTILIADPSGRTEPQRFDLEGNLAPEAFTSGEGALVVIEYLPPQAPDRYRVRQLVLRPMQGQRQRQLQVLLTRDKRPNLEEMRGTGRFQVFGPGCRTLYTLYTRQPDHVHARNMPALGGSGQTIGQNGNVHAFVHVLGLDGGWAFCLDLPRPFGAGPASAQTLAISRDGWRLYAADASSGTVVTADTGKLQITSKAGVGTELFGDRSRAAAAAAPKGALYLASGAEVVAVDGTTLEVGQRWPVDGVVRGLGVSADGQRIYVGVDGRVVALDAESGRTVATIQVPGLVGIAHVGQVAQSRSTTASSRPTSTISPSSSYASRTAASAGPSPAMVSPPGNR